MFQYSIILIGGTKIDITEEERKMVRDQIKAKNPCITIGDHDFSYHQFSTIMPIEEANFAEKMRLREKGFFKCRSFGVIHKLGEPCVCKDSGEKDPRLNKPINKTLLANPVNDIHLDF